MKNLENKIKLLSGTLLLGALLLSSLPAQAQLDKPWGFNGQNRASIAALMKQVEDQGASAVITSSGSGDITSLVCGSDGSASAKGNASCIILNNSDADIYLGQDSAGDQTATSEETTNVDETINTNVEALDDVLETLSGDADTSVL